jgi:hypothetical protein
LPPVVGVPEIRPDEPRLNPGGSEPDRRLKVTAPCPPEASTGEEYACPTVPEESGEAEVMLRGEQITERPVEPVVAQPPEGMADSV